MSMVQAATDRERELGGIINAYNEVTERLKESHDRLVGEVKRLREQVEEKSRELARRERLAALGEMAAGVAHEIRNPLAGIQLYASLLMKDAPAGSEARRLAERISTGVHALDGIVTDVLDFSGQQEPQRVQALLGAVIDQCLAYVAPAQDSRGTKIVVDESAKVVTVMADVGQLHRAVLNLLFNAIDAAGDEGEVLIAARPLPEAAMCEIKIVDSGPGIPVENLNKIFNPFFTTKDSGTGLGLAIVHRIAEANGGCVRAENRIGYGAEMTLVLPIVDDQATDKIS